MIKNKQNSQHYKWGDNCSGWRLEDSEQLSIIQEIMPPDTSEDIHFHNHATQFFFILEGKAEITLDGKTHSLQKNDGIKIKSGTKHFIKNIFSKPVEFLVISTPSTKSDRININQREIK